MKDKEFVLSLEPTATCMKAKKAPYQRTQEYNVFVDGDPNLEIGIGLSPYAAWKDASEMIKYLMVWKLEQ